MSSKDHIGREKMKPHLKLAKRREEEKMEISPNWNFQENATNGELGKRGKGKWSRIFRWMSLGRACKERNERRRRNASQLG